MPGAGLENAKVPGAAVSPLGLEVTRRGPWAVIRLSGELDYASCPGLRAHLGMVLGAVPRPQVAVDVSGLEFCDSAGLGCFVWAHQRARQRGGTLMLAGPDAWLARLFHITGLNQVLRISGALPDGADGVPGRQVLPPDAISGDLAGV